MSLAKRWRICITYFLILTLFLSTILNAVGAQTVDLNDQESKTWSPSTKRFKIVVPMDPKEVEEEPLKDASHTTYGTNRLYGVTSDQYVIKIYDLELVPRASKMNLKDKFGGLEFVIGGDDDFDFTETSLRIDGHPAKEIVYAKSNAKGLMIDAGGRIFVLVLITKNRVDLDSRIAKNLFSSFKLVKK